VDCNDNNEDEEDDDKKNTITKKPKMTSARKNSKNKNRLTPTRSMMSPLMQERMTILSHMRNDALCFYLTCRHRQEGRTIRGGYDAEDAQSDL
jgi:hypothetical protein